MTGDARTKEIAAAEIGPPVTFGRPGRRGRRAVTSRWLVERYGRRREDPVRLAWLADSRRLLVAYRGADGTPYIEIKDTDSGARLSPAAGTEAVLSPDRGRVAYRGRDGQVRVVPADGGRPVVPGRRCPTVVDVHGGPEGGVHLTGGALLTSSPVERQLWAGKGYAVFVPDYRSSAIPGWEAVVEAKEAGDFAERDGLDLISGVRALVQAGIADPDRLALTGFSAGADTGCYLLTRTSMFKAAVLNDGWAEHFYASTATGGTGSEMQEWLFGGPPWQHDDDRVLRNSATHRARAITTPTLFVAGGQAAGGPAESFGWRYLAASMRRRGVDVRFLIYPDEGHGLDDPHNQRDLIDRAAAWIDARCA